MCRILENCKQKFKVKKISIRIIRLVALIAGVMFSMGMVQAQTPLDADMRHAVVDSIISPWNDWEQVTINGKLKMAGLPVTPSVKICMQRDSSIYISLRAPFVGEVGRAEITDSTALVVNKMKKVYVEESLEKVFSFYPGGISDLQNLFLGRVALPGLGQLSHDIEEGLEIYSENDSTYSMVVTEENSIPGVNYGYVFDSGYWPVALLVLPVATPDVAVTIAYEYFENGYDMSFLYQSEKKNIKATLEFDEPDWEGRPFDRIKLNSKYKRVELKDFLKSTDI